jgi:hypothetical protein
MGAYAYREGADEVPAGENDHGPDALRYFVMNHWGSEAEAEGMALR